MTSAGSGKDARHPDLLRIDALRAVEATAEESEHVRNCPACAALLSRLAGAAEEMRKSAPLPEEVPQKVSSAVMNAYRDAFAKPGAETWVWRRWLRVPVFAPAAAAAALIVAVMLLIPHRASIVSPVPTASIPAGSVPSISGQGGVGDVNGDGRLDILDAFSLAKMLERGSLRDLRFDMNADGTVDRADVAAVSRMAVAL